MKRIELCVVLLCILIGYKSQADEPQNPAETRAAHEKIARIEYLIEMLASKNSEPPIHGPSDDRWVSFPTSYDKSLQVPVYLAIQQLLSGDECAIDRLLNHVSDNRYSITVESSGAANIQASTMCFWIAKNKILCFQPEIHFISHDQDFLYPHVATPERLQAWWNENKHKGLVALQVEAIDASIDFMHRVDWAKARGRFLSEGKLPEDDFNRLRQENIPILKGIRETIVATGRPYCPKMATEMPWLRRMVGLPWTRPPTR